MQSFGGTSAWYAQRSRREAWCPSSWLFWTEDQSDFGVSGDTNRMEESRLGDLAQDRNGFGRLVGNG